MAPVAGAPRTEHLKLRLPLSLQRPHARPSVGPIGGARTRFVDRPADPALRTRFADRRSDLQALVRLAHRLELGLGVRRDSARAWRLWLAAAHAGEAPLRLEVARRLLTGDGVRPDRLLAQRLLAFDAARGDTTAQQTLGESLVKASTHSEKRAGLRWLARAAANGSTDAAALWTRHIGELPAPHRLAADREADSLALKPLTASTAPTAPDDPRSADPALLRALAIAGTPWAQTALAHALSRHPESAVEAAGWWIQAATQGDSLAAAALADAYALGRGVIRNDATAYAWWCIAHRHDPQTLAPAYPWAARLTPSVIAEATRQVAGHTERPPL